MQILTEEQDKAIKACYESNSRERLTGERAQELAIYAKTNSECRNFLIKLYEGLIVCIAKNYLRSQIDYGIKSLSLDELIQAGRIGLDKAVNSYDPKRGVPFRKYSPIRIHGNMKDENRAFRKIRFDKSLQGIIGDEDSGAELLDLIIEDKLDYDGSEHPNPLKYISRAEEKVMNLDYVRTLLLRLDARKRQVVYNYFFKGKTMKEIGISLKNPISESRACQLLKEALGELREFAA